MFFQFTEWISEATAPSPRSEGQAVSTKKHVFSVYAEKLGVFVTAWWWTKSDWLQKRSVCNRVYRHDLVVQNQQIQRANESSKMRVFEDRMRAKGDREF